MGFLFLDKQATYIFPFHISFSVFALDTNVMKHHLKKVLGRNLATGACRGLHEHLLGNQVEPKVLYDYAVSITRIGNNPSCEVRKLVDRELSLKVLRVMLLNVVHFVPRWE